jgi:tRNA pseudouridine38-40 synthase
VAWETRNQWYTTSGTMSRMTRRWRLDVAYDGTDFAGWARQSGVRTVQGILEVALATVLRTPSVTLVVAGRTDAGVHARGQVCHVDLPDEVESGLGEGSFEYALRRRLARLLPDDVRVSGIARAPQGFDARFSAVWRRYAYRIWEDPASADPLRRREVLAWPNRLDELTMNEAARTLVGTHDFAAFCRRRETGTTIRVLHRFGWHRVEGLLVAEVVADAFCHQMVRSLVGASALVGEGKRPVSWLATLLSGRVRDPTVPVVAAHGLTLEEVGYPRDTELAARAVQTRALRSSDT